MRKSVCAIIKCHNEELFLRECITSVFSFADEIIVVNNNSSDASVDIAKSMDVKLCNFDGHPGGNFTMASYYNWCSEQSKCEYILKLDADVVMFDKLYDLFYLLDGKVEAIIYPLYNIKGDHRHIVVLNNGLCGPEPYIFKKNIRHYDYKDGIERLPFWGERKSKTILIQEPVGLHLNIKSDERYFLREEIKSYRDLNQIHNMSLKEWSMKRHGDNYLKLIDRHKSKWLKEIRLFSMPHPELIENYVSKPKWLVVYSNNIPSDRVLCDYS